VLLTALVAPFAQVCVLGSGKPMSWRSIVASTATTTGGLVFFDQENWGVNGQGLTVDQVTPEFVKAKMRLLSTVRLMNIRVAPH
jgi:hypothetical protein